MIPAEETVYRPVDSCSLEVAVCDYSGRMPCCSIPSWPADSPADVTSFVVCCWKSLALLTARPIPTAIPTPASLSLLPMPAIRPPASSDLTPDATAASPAAVCASADSFAAAVVFADAATLVSPDAFAAPAARPGRSFVTVVAVLFGAAAVTFGVGLSVSLNHVFNDIAQGSRLPVQVRPLPPGVTSNPAGPGKGGKGGKAGKGGPRKSVSIIGPGAQPLTEAQQRSVTAAIDAQPGTLHYLTERNDSLNFPGLGGANGGAFVTAYGGGDPAWSKLALISGTWYSQSPGTAEIDVNTLFLTDTGTQVGDSYPMVNGTRKVTAKIVGEVFDPGNDADVYMSPSTLAAIDPTAAGVSQDVVSLKPGVNADAYASSLQGALGDTYNVNDSSGGAKELIAITVLVAMLTLLIIAVAGLGVLNTVALQIREKAHDIGVFKALGMTPGQTLAMVVCSVGITGLVAGIVAVPAGVALHHNVLPTMAHAANSGLPASVVAVYSLPELIGLALAGLVIAVAGALAPATWASRSRTATALRTE